MTTYEIEFLVQGPFYKYDKDIKRIEKVIGTTLKEVWQRVHRFELNDDDAGALIVLKFTCEDIICSLKQLEKLENRLSDNEYMVVANIC